RELETTLDDVRTESRTLEIELSRLRAAHIQQQTELKQQQTELKQQQTELKSLAGHLERLGEAIDSTSNSRVVKLSSLLGSKLALVLSRAATASALALKEIEQIRDRVSREPNFKKEVFDQRVIDRQVILVDYPIIPKSRPFASSPA